MGRDRDPFNRTLQALRERLAHGRPLQGAALPVNALADQLGVSPTPVREALSRLAGEGLVARTPAGYAGVVHDRRSLAGLYALAGVLTEAALDQALPPDPGADIRAAILSPAADGVLMEALARVRAQLAPFATAEQRLLGAQDDEDAVSPGANAGAVRTSARRYWRRRVRKAGEIFRFAVLED